MVRLDRRTLERLESKYPKVSVGGRPDGRDELEEYYMALEDYQREQQGLPPIHDAELAALDNDPVLEKYFEELREQEAARDAALQRREH